MDPTRADHVIVASEAHAASRMLRYVDPPLAALLQVIPYASSATVSLGYRRGDVPHPLDGFGFVVPRIEGKRLLACTFSSVKYPGRAPEGHALLRCFLGGALDASVLDEDDGALAGRAREELRAALGVTAEPVISRVTRHAVAMPQYAVGHLASRRGHRAPAGSGARPVLAGAAYRGVGIADCVRFGETAAERALGAHVPVARFSGSILTSGWPSVAAVSEPLSPTAQKVQDALSAQGFPYQVVESATTSRTAAEAAALVGCELAQIVKSLVFRTKESGRPVLVLTSGANQVNEWRIGALLKEPLEKARAAFVREHTGFAIGGVAPLGHPKALETFIDQDLLKLPEIWAAAGTPNALFRLAPGDLVKMTGGRVIKVT